MQCRTDEGPQRPEGDAASFGVEVHFDRQRRAEAGASHAVTSISIRVLMSPRSVIRWLVTTVVSLVCER